MRYSRNILALAVLPLLITATARAQRGGYYNDEATPLGVVIGVRGGIVVSSARGTFPSLLMDSTKKGSGDIAQQYAASGSGSRFGLTFLIPFSSRIGLSGDIGTLVYSAKYNGTNMPAATMFTAQTFQLGFGLQGTIFSDSASFGRGSGLRSVYVDGGLDIALATMRNRVTAARYADTSATAQPTASTDHFENNDAFRSLVGLRGGIGMRFAVSMHWELQAEAAYTFAINKIFSSDAIRNNDFTVDNFAIQAGIGYRF